jgi:hypothetical protein
MTTVLHLVARRLTFAVQPCSYAEVMRVDKIFHGALSGIPTPLKRMSRLTISHDAPALYFHHIL